MNAVLRVAGLAVTIFCWWHARHDDYSDAWAAALMWSGVPLGFLAALWGRRMLVGRPRMERVDRVTVAVHYLLMILFGCAVLAMLRIGRAHPLAAIPVPTRYTYPLLVGLGAFTLLTVADLALRGLGAPFALALSRRMAGGWLYTRTRNPMLLGCLLFAVTLGLWMQSAHVVLWSVFWLSPAWLGMARVFEERELELRFGKPYLAYKAETPFLWPRLRVRRAGAARRS